jgi:hypothetical protein
MNIECGGCSLVQCFCLLLCSWDPAKLKTGTLVKWRIEVCAIRQPYASMTPRMKNGKNASERIIQMSLLPTAEEQLPYRKRMLIKILLYIAGLYVDGDEHRTQFKEFATEIARGY